MTPTPQARPATPPAMPAVVTRQQWLTERRRLLEREKTLTRLRDQVSAERRRLPMVRIEKDYVFEGPDGETLLHALFAGRRQLYVHHFMWMDAHDGPCHRCSATADQNFTPPMLERFAQHDLAFAAVCRAPWPKLAALRQRKGWTFPFFSSHGSDFNTDFHATLDPSRAPIEYNFQDRDALLRSGIPEEDLRGDWPGASVFLRDGDTVYHTYSAYARGMDIVDTPYNFLDMTPYGRQEDWEDSPPSWPQHATYG